jgi:hypothetical protein
MLFRNHRIYEQSYAVGNGFEIRISKIKYERKKNIWNSSDFASDAGIFRNELGVQY